MVYTFPQFDLQFLSARGAQFLACQWEVNRRHVALGPARHRAVSWTWHHDGSSAQLSALWTLPVNVFHTDHGERGGGGGEGVGM